MPRFLCEHDHPWLRALLDEHERFIGRPQRELEARLRDPPSWESPPTKRKQAIQVLARLRRGRDRRAAVPPRRARALVFAEAARTKEPRATVLSTVAATLGVAADELQDSLFADLPGERLIAPLPSLSPGELALRTNLALVQALLSRATSVRIEAEGNSRVLVRHAKLRGLICTVASRSGAGDAVLDLSGPFALFRHTRLYGRALG
ncbi:MAG: DUF790 family protein, partial [candidate division NC10 bacterium]